MTNGLSRQVGQILKASGIKAKVKGNDFMQAVRIRADESLYAGIEVLMIGNGLNARQFGRDLYVQRF